MKKKSFTVAKLIIIPVTLLLVAFIYFFLLNKQDSNNQEAVFSNPDGSVRQVVNYLKKTELKNPDSFTPVHWSKLQKTETFGITGYRVGVIYRAKNENNEFATYSKVFELDDKGSIVFVSDIGPMNN